MKKYAKEIFTVAMMVILFGSIYISAKEEHKWMGFPVGVIYNIK